MHIKSAVLAFLLFFPFAASAAPQSDMSLLSRRIIEPINRQELRRHMGASLLTRNTRHTQAMSADETRLSYVYTVQLPDGSLMKVPENYDVTRTAEHARKGVYNDLTVYAVRREGSAKDLVVIGLTPNDQIVVLDPSGTTQALPSQ